MTDQLTERQLGMYDRLLEMFATQDKERRAEEAWESVPNSADADTNESIASEDNDQ